MKTIPFTPGLWLALAALAANASAQETYALADAPTPAAPTPAAPVAAPAPRASAQEPGLRFNFRGAPLETVLNYMSEAAGFIIVLETPVRGTVDMWSSQPVSKAEAVQLLNSALNKNGYAASVQGRSLIVTSKEDAKKRNIPIRTGNDPTEIPQTAEMVMQIIPLRHIDAMQASRDLATLLPGSATLTANQDSNSLVVTDTQMNVRHIVELVSALDTSIDSVSAMRVFRLKNSDPMEMAQLLTNVFSGTANRAGGNQGGQGGGGGFNAGNFGQGGFGGNFGGGGGAGGGGGGAVAAAIAAARGGNNAGGGRNARAGGGARATPVVAVADPRTYSVIVTASKDAMPEIAEIVAQLDASTARKQKVYVYTLENADVKQVEAILKNLFQSSNTRGSTSTQADPLSARALSNSQTSPSTSSLSIGNTGNRAGAP